MHCCKYTVSLTTPHPSAAMVVYLPWEYCCWSLLYSAIFHSWADSLCSCCVWFLIIDCHLFINITFLNIHQSGVFKCCLVVTWLVPHKPAADSVHSLCTPCISLQYHFIQSYICMIHVFSCRCNLPPALLAEWQGSFTCYSSNTGVERIPK